ncbi:MAG: MATE family efflux transporter [Candidatus Cloacimonadales bacterium]
MSKKKDLTEEKIFSSLLKLALPIMATSFVQMTYNIVDMLWLGRAGSNQVAAAGTAGFFVWFGFAFILISKVGAEVGVAQSTGRKDELSARDYARNAIQLNLVLAAIYGTFLYLFRGKLIAFFQIGDPQVTLMAESYLAVVAVGIIFMFLNPVFSGIFNGLGDSKTPFYVNSAGLVFNLILDPILIFGWGIFPAMGVLGAAIATIFSQFIVTTIFLCLMWGKRAPFSEFHLFLRPIKSIMQKIFQFGTPVALQSGLFSIFAMVIGRIIAQWGPIPIAVQKVGSQIEAISWMTASGFATALSSFVGQNYGAEKWHRIWKGYAAALSAVSVVGIMASLLLVFFAKPIFQLFIPEPEAIEVGVVYLKILGYSQLFMCLEITTAGAFNGLGKPIPPSIVSIIFTGARVPAAIILSSSALLGLPGVWWSISASSMFKGTILVVWFIIFLRKHPTIIGPKFKNLAIFKWDLRYLRDKRGLSGRI